MQLNNLIFKKDTHQYFIGENEKYSVSKILAHYLGNDFFCKDCNSDINKCQCIIGDCRFCTNVKKACLKGKAVHKVAELYFKNIDKENIVQKIKTKILSLFSEEIIQYCFSLLNYLEESFNKNSNSISEKHISYDIVAGTPDLISENERFIFDFKTSRTMTEKQLHYAKLQLTAYYWILLKNNINSNNIAFIIHINEKGFWEIPFKIDEQLLKEWEQALINSLATIFELNLSNNPIKKEIALIPYGNDLQVQIQEDGFLTLLQRSNCVVDFQREIITTNHFYNKDTKKWELDPAKIFEKKEIIGYFGSISIKNNLGKVINFYKGMTKQECIDWKNKYSKASSNSAWNTSFDSMALKTVIKSIIRDINKDPSISLENQSLIDRAMQVDQSAVINNDEIIYVDNPKNDNQKVKLKPIDEKINNDEYINKNVSEKLELIEEPFIKDEFEEMNKIIDELEI